jgi:hypothetical protein
MADKHEKIFIITEFRKYHHCTCSLDSRIFFIPLTLLNSSPLPHIIKQSQTFIKAGSLLAEHADNIQNDLNLTSRNISGSIVSVIWNYEETAKTTDTRALKAFDNFHIQEFYSIKKMFLNVSMFPRYAITAPCKFAFENCPLKVLHLAISKLTKFFSSPLRPNRLWDAPITSYSTWLSAGVKRPVRQVTNEWSYPFTSRRPVCLRSVYSDNFFIFSFLI